MSLASVICTPSSAQPTTSLPTIYANAGFVINIGGLISYAANLVDLYGEAMSYIDRILKGAKPADLPVQLPSRYRLAISLKTAKAIDLTVPPSLLARADEVLE